MITTVHHCDLQKATINKKQQNIMVIDFGHSTPLPKSQRVIIFSQVNLSKTPIKNILHLYKNDDNNNNQLLSNINVFFNT